MLITEKRIYRVDPVMLQTDGTTTGKLSVPDSSIFRVGQIVILKADNQLNLELKINRIDPVDKVTMYLGPVKQHISKRSDISAYTVAANATLQANEQERPPVPEQEVERITYEEEPVVARRTILVDKYGCRIDDNNPLPISGNLSIGVSSGNPNIFNISAPLSNTEYSQILPNGTTHFLIRARNNSKLQISYSAGQTNTTFLTITPGTIYTVDSVKLIGKTIYFRSTKDNTVIEIVAWN